MVMMMIVMEVVVVVVVEKGGETSGFFPSVLSSIFLVSKIFYIQRQIFQDSFVRFWIFLFNDKKMIKGSRLKRSKEDGIQGLVNEIGTILRR